MKTDLGEIKQELFVKRCAGNGRQFHKTFREKFYDGTRFHRVIKGFMIQGGDPNSKDDNWLNDGIGGRVPLSKRRNKFNKIIRGVLAMANAGPNTQRGQFLSLPQKARRG